MNKFIDILNSFIGIFFIISLFFFSPFVQARTGGRLPSFFNAYEHFIQPDITDIARLRFVTTFDFPPFNFLNKTGHLAGYNADLLRAICVKLKLEKLCEVEVLPREELVNHLKNDGAEAIITSLEETMEMHQYLIFTQTYLRFPARFVSYKSLNLNEPISDKLDHLKSGFLIKSAHEKLFHSYFSKSKWQGFTDRKMLYKALQNHEIDLIFDDGLVLSLWINDPQSMDCCHFVGGAYMAPQFLGAGMRIAVAKKNAKLVDILNYALKSLERDGKLTELYLRYFPISFY
ncbi:MULTISPECIES: transporter substrate-binding domain-containing protein [unclassified Bartonella]|uniref:transporter substrate-binding domain-containing protein n=1 Tax=unclassified Bartonella TaxID=2645622 RepID=UPI0009995232|nr:MULTISPECIES: transporter substrate-binding domain-containing protein [unclassified Bartonella]AQX28634.1 amino acid ABC transporter substrate-binding protein, PAAT family [Bartonella sp. JB15]AQX29890.1 amino acid ABC transporter substrate-binding protein, PAAT family [Bartonella sp. JB63]